MMQKYKFFYKETTLSIEIYQDILPKNLIPGEDFVFEDKIDLNSALKIFLEKEKSIRIFCLPQNEKTLFDQIKQFFNFIEAAGGIVYNSDKNLLVIQRYGYYDFPKGHVEKGESFEEAALREVKEETHLSKLSILEKTQSTFHIFPAHGRFSLKKTHWFIMSSDKNETLIPQTEEGITSVEWMPPTVVKQHISAFYPSLQELIKELEV